MPDIYYHGTFMKSAVDELTAGQPLQPMRPEGKSVVKKSRAGFVYITPSFNVAAEYAFSKARSDWPTTFEGAYADQPHVFEFHHVDGEMEPDEDELGFAYKVALCIKAGVTHEWSMNSEFAKALTSSTPTIEKLAANAERLRGNAAIDTFLNNPQAIRGVKRTAFGHKMLPKTDQGLQQELIDLGISVATTMELKAVAAYSMTARVMKAEDADEVWRHQPAIKTEGLRPCS